MHWDKLLGGDQQRCKFPWSDSNKLTYILRDALIKFCSITTSHKIYNCFYIYFGFLKILVYKFEGVNCGLLVVFEHAPMGQVVAPKQPRCPLGCYLNFLKSCQLVEIVR